MDPAIEGLTTSVNSLWLLVAAALVLLMTPGVAFFYGGMVKAKSVISMMMMSFGAMGLVGVLWVVYGYGMVFGTPLIPGIVGNPFDGSIGLSNVTPLTGQTDALRLVAFVDRVYDAQIRVLASGTPLDQVFAGDMMDGGYRKKYLRAVSRLIASATL